MEKRIIKINEKFGGHPIHLSNLRYDLNQAKQITNNPYKKNAHIIRGIIAGHTFSDGNKRTATYIVSHNFRKEGCTCDKQLMMHGIQQIAHKKISNIQQIEGKLRKWCKKE